MPIYEVRCSRCVERIDISARRDVPAAVGRSDLGPGIGHWAQHLLDAEGSGLHRARRWRGHRPGDAQAAFLNRRIEEAFPFQEEFDRASISFTLHGFEDENKERGIANVHGASKPGALFWILDYNEFDLDCQRLPFRWAFRRFEC